MRAIIMETKILIISAILALFLLHLLPANSQEVEDETEFSYQSGSATGPENWGRLKKEWVTCSIGLRQSPIDLLDKKVVAAPILGDLQKSYRPSNATIINRGHDIMVQWSGDAGGLWIKGIKYNFQQLHWHSPSEHTINGKRYALELHMVHTSYLNHVAVVSVLYNFGRRPDPFLAELEGYIRAVGDKKDGRVEVGMVDASDVAQWGREYYRYMGSLTTPPCTEGVVWTVKKQPQSVTREQVHLLREAVHDGFEENARPIQATNGRVVLLYKPRQS